MNARNEQEIKELRQMLDDLRHENSGQAAIIESLKKDNQHWSTEWFYARQLFVDAHLHVVKLTKSIEALLGSESERSKKVARSCASAAFRWGMEVEKDIPMQKWETIK